MQPLKKPLRTLVALLVCLAGTATWLAIDLERYADKQVSVSTDEIRVTVQAGQSLGSIARMLYGAGVIDHPRKFQLVARFNGWDRRIKAGEYRLRPAMTIRGLLEEMVQGRVYLHRLTIPEGYTLNQIAEAVEEAGLGEKEAILGLCRDADFARVLGIEAGSLEGYLFPDTYYFAGDTRPRQIVETMAARFREVFTPQWVQRAGELGMTVHEVVTLASIVEKETGAADERPLVASVFHNRLKKGMRLESDPTVIYGAGDYAGDLTRSHLRTPTPYNTYTISGLPPGPIANPGLKALAAVLYPAETPFLFFVAKPDGAHHFSATLQEHNRAVQRYQLHRSPG